MNIFNIVQILINKHKLWISVSFQGSSVKTDSCTSAIKILLHSSVILLPCFVIMTNIILQTKKLNLLIMFLFFLILFEKQWQNKFHVVFRCV